MEGEEEETDYGHVLRHEKQMRPDLRTSQKKD
jgi:hypothetical protein